MPPVERAPGLQPQLERNQFADPQLKVVAQLGSAGEGAVELNFVQDPVAPQFAGLKQIPHLRGESGERAVEQALKAALRPPREHRSWKQVVERIPCDGAIAAAAHPQPARDPQA